MLNQLDSKRYCISAAERDVSSRIDAARASVCLSHRSTAATGVIWFAAERPAGRRCRSIADAGAQQQRRPPCCARQGARSTALSSKCGQRHVASRRRRLNTDLSSIFGDFRWSRFCHFVFWSAWLAWCFYVLRQLVVLWGGLISFPHLHLYSCSFIWLGRQLRDAWWWLA